jgi:hypothetical protein
VASIDVQGKPNTPECMSIVQRKSAKSQLDEGIGRYLCVVGAAEVEMEASLGSSPGTYPFRYAMGKVSVGRICAAQC